MKKLFGVVLGYSIRDLDEVLKDTFPDLTEMRLFSDSDKAIAYAQEELSDSDGSYSEAIICAICVTGEFDTEKSVVYKEASDTNENQGMEGGTSETT
jgi:hypothetical protein